MIEGFTIENELSGHHDMKFIEGTGSGFADIHGELNPGCQEIGDIEGHGGEVFVEGDGDWSIILIDTGIKIGPIETLKHGQGDISIQSGVDKLNGKFGSSVRDLNVWG